MGASQERPPHEDAQFVRAVLLVGIAAGLALPVYFFRFASTTPLAWDFLAYLHGVDLFLAGEPFVGASPEVGNGQYVYPPIVVTLFAPYALAESWATAFLVQSALNLLLGLVLAALIVRVVEDRLDRRLPRIDRGLIVAFCLASTYPMIALGQGQVDHVVAVALVAGFLWVERDQDVKSGLAFAFAAVLKLFPALVGLWLLHRRASRSIATATTAGVSTLGASLLLFGVDTHVRYVKFILTERSRVRQFEGTMDPNFMALTLNRPLSMLLPELDPRLYTAIAALLFLPVLWVLYGRSRTFEDRLVSFLGTLIAILLVSPASNLNHALYLYFPILTLSYVLDHGPSRRLLLSGLLVMSVPVQPAQFRRLSQIAGLSPDAQATLTSGIEPALTFASVTLYGLVIVVAGCLARAIRAGQDRPTADRTGQEAD